MPKTRVFTRLMIGNKAGLWASLGGGFLIFVAWQSPLVLMAIFMPATMKVLGGGAQFLGATQEAKTMFTFLVGGFGPGFLAMMAWRKYIEKRAVSTLFTAKSRFRWRLLAVSSVCMITLGVALSLALDPQGTDDISARNAQFSVGDWAILTLAYVIGIGVQATFEEVFVRGWLLQHVSRFLPHLGGAVLATAVIFSLLHVGHAGWATYVVALVFGLAFGWSAVRLNGLEAAIGAHVGNNLIGALLAGQMISGNPPSMDGPQLALFGLYVFGFLAFVEAWARFEGKALPLVDEEADGDDEKDPLEVFR